MMPEMDGYEVCKRLRADEKLREIPIIFITALNETADKVRAFSVGGVDYVTKPFQLWSIRKRAGLESFSTTGVRLSSGSDLSRMRHLRK